MKKKFLLCFIGLFVVCLSPWCSLAQTGQTGMITGRVLTDAGEGLPRASVSIRQVRSGPQGPAFGNLPSVTTDDDGSFSFTDLPTQVYEINVSQTKEYAMQPEAGASGQRYYRVGEHVTVTLIRGGVITGRVTTPEGEPVIGAPVLPSMVRDTEGHPIRQNVGRISYTDDRGSYRLFGLPPGVYVVSTAGASSAQSAGRQARIYHPSSTVDTATEVTVVSGGEVGGTDILLRKDPGHVISGSVVGDGESSPYLMANIFLTNVATGASMFGSARRTASGSNDFAIYGVADGVYEIVARRNGFGNEVEFASSPRRVTVKGSDLAGIELRIAPLGSISGKIVIEPSTGLCESKSGLSREEILLFSRRKESPVRSTGVDDDGEFTISALAAGTYHIQSQLPEETWYLRSISIPGTVVSKGIALKAGRKLTGMIMSIAEGAAGLRGKIVAEKEGAALPSQLRIQLVPSEAAAANDHLRYAETLMRSDQTFEFKNLIPGKYWITTQAVAEPETAWPAAYDDAARAKLRKEAEARKIEVELKPCQRLTDQVVRH
jgi:carboxypeptidase family protein